MMEQSFRGRIPCSSIIGCFLWVKRKERGRILMKTLAPKQKDCFWGPAAKYPRLILREKIPPDIQEHETWDPWPIREAVSWKSRNLGKSIGLAWPYASAAVLDVSDVGLHWDAHPKTNAYVHTHTHTPTDARCSGEVSGWTRNALWTLQVNLIWLFRKFWLTDSSTFQFFHNLLL